MRKIKNPFIETKDFYCFGCSPDNNDGLKMEFFEEGDEIISEWEPLHHFQGYVNVLHGGIQSALIDEIAYWTVLVKNKTACVTAKLDIRLKKPVYMDKGKITLRAKLTEVKQRFARVTVKLLDSDKLVCATGNVYYYTYPIEESVNHLSFPSDYSGFFNNKTT
jgi:acyl-coenzyme A thioesterase PaaI-like protein